jgi:carbon monoxide dehydrogenase subunit G
MQLEQSFDLPVPPAAAWPAFENVELLVECLPGAALTGPAVDGELPLQFAVKLGPIAAAFVGGGRVNLDAATRGGRFEGTATDRRTSSRVKGAAEFKLAAEGTGTRVSLLVDYSLTGPLAQFSRGAIVRELASALTSQFAANLAQRVHAITPTAPTPVSAAAVAAATAPLDAGSLLMLAIRSAWERLLGRLFRRSA